MWAIIHVTDVEFIKRQQCFFIIILQIIQHYFIMLHNRFNWIKQFIFSLVWYVEIWLPKQIQITVSNYWVLFNWAV